MALYTTLKDAIDSYLGLTPTAFFTILALMVGVYLLVSSFFVSPDAAAPAAAQRSFPPPVTVKEPVQMGDVTVEELRAFDGSDPEKPLLMAIKGSIYDVSRSRMFYGPGGPYALFAGRDASRALALMSFDSNDLTGYLEGLSSADLEVLQDWEYKFMEKYVKVGQLVSDITTGKDVKQSNKEVEEIAASGDSENSKTAIGEDNEGVQDSLADACKNIETKEIGGENGGG